MNIYEYAEAVRDKTEDKFGMAFSAKQALNRGERVQVTLMGGGRVLHDVTGVSGVQVQFQTERGTTRNVHPSMLRSVEFPDR